MEEAVFLDDEQRTKNLYDEIKGYIRKSPVHRCIIEHAAEMITESDLAKKVLACRAEECPNRNTLEFKRAFNELVVDGIIDKYITPKNYDLHYKNPPFVLSVTEHLKKLYPKPSGHL